MTTLDQVRLGLAARLETINQPTDQLHVYDLVPGDVTAPAAIIGGPTVTDYRSDPEPVLDATFTIALAVSTGDPTNQLQLYPFLERTGSKSIVAAIEADRRLGGLDVDAYVQSATQLGQQDIGATKYYVATVTVRALIG